MQHANSGSIMDSRTKSDIIREISECIDAKNNIFVECLVKKTNKVITVNVQFEDQKSFVDENGVKWVKE